MHTIITPEVPAMIEYTDDSTGETIQAPQGQLPTGWHQVTIYNGITKYEIVIGSSSPASALITSAIQKIDAERLAAQEANAARINALVGG